MSTHGFSLCMWREEGEGMREGDREGVEEGEGEEEREGMLELCDISSY